MVPFACWHFPHYANFVHICNCRARETFYTDIYFQVTVKYPKDLSWQMVHNYDKGEKFAFHSQFVCLEQN